MMFFTHFILALIVAVLLALAFASVSGARRPWSGMLTFLLIILLASWSGGIWISPFGPVLWSATWLPFLLAGLIVALVFAGAAMPEKEESTVELVDPGQRRRQREGARLVLNVFVSALILILLVSIVIRYAQAI
jgi:hypothetical protein